MNIKKRNRVQKRLVERCARLHVYTTGASTLGHTPRLNAYLDGLATYVLCGVPYLQRQVGHLLTAAGNPAAYVSRESDTSGGTMQSWSGDAVARLWRDVVGGSEELP